MMGYFGTNTELPELIPFKAGPLRGVYEAGKLRYLQIGDTEVVRMIYPAIRDRNWVTAPAEIIEENIAIQEDSFSIEYTARYQLNEIDYQAKYLIIGDAKGNLSVAMQGEAKCTFWRNRIGLCVHHPIEPCKGKPVWITHPDQRKTESIFPVMISPHQPFFDIRSMSWSPVEGVQVQLEFEGDVFETEDQRNWTDTSYKTYSTPLSLPYPVEVQKGEKLHQKLQLHCTVSVPQASAAAQNLVVVNLNTATYPFPALGTFGVQSALSPDAIKQVQGLPIDYLSELLHLEQENWRTDLKAMFAQAKSLQKRVALSVFFTRKEDCVLLLEALAPFKEQLQQLCVLSATDKVADATLMKEIYERIKARFPQLPIGFGTDGFFTALNRNRPGTSHFDFLQFSLNPQVHAVDTRTLIENLVAQRDVVHTAQSFAEGKPLYVSPITLRPRYTPDPADAIDPRQHSLFVAAWTLISLKYLAPCAALTYFETIGPKGLMADPQQRSPLVDYLQQIARFQPSRILDTYSNSPLKVELLLLENTTGARLACWVNFSTEEQKAMFQDQNIELAPESVTLLDWR